MTAIEQAREVVRWCRALSRFSEDPSATTRTFLSPPMRDVHAQLSAWMRRIGMATTIDAAGNLRGIYPASSTAGPARRFYMGSHLDTVPSAGAFDGILGVVLAIAIVDQLQGKQLPFAIEVAGFSEEEGVRFGAPFIGSRAMAGTLDDALLGRTDTAGVSVREAIAAYGLDIGRLGEARASRHAMGYLEFHIEQGPVLEHLNLPVGIVETIVGQTRGVMTFTGAANHAGTTPMALRRDAVAAAAEWIMAVEQEALAQDGLVATVGRVDAEPGAGNVIAGRCHALLDLRHAQDAVRRTAVDRLVARAEEIATRRGLEAAFALRLDQAAVVMDHELTSRLVHATAQSGVQPHRMPSGAGHDAMIIAAQMPAAMLFVRSPGGVSHHPSETVLEDDVALALTIGLSYLEGLARG